MPRNFLKRQEIQVSGFAKLRRLNERIFGYLEYLDNPGVLQYLEVSLPVMNI